MPQQVSLISADDVPAGSASEVVVAGQIFAVYNVEGEFHVLDGICPHAGGPLGKGTLTGCVVTCPWHGWQFDVSTGQHQLSDGICQPGYAASVVDGMVVVELDDDNSD